MPSERATDSKAATIQLLRMRDIDERIQGVIAEVAEPRVAEPEWRPRPITPAELLKRLSRHMGNN